MAVGRRALAAALLTLVLLLILVVPLYLGISAIVTNVDTSRELSQTVATWSVPQPPDWLDGIPLVGAKLASQWRELAGELRRALDPGGALCGDVARWFVGQLGGIGSLFFISC